MGKPRDPHYWRAWRAAHPDYRGREVDASRERKRKRTAEQRRAERRRAKERADELRRHEPAPTPAARRYARWLAECEAIVRRHVRPDRRAVLEDPLYADAVGVALVERWRSRTMPASARERLIATAVAAYVREERGWRSRTAPFLPEILSRNA